MFMQHGQTDRHALRINLVQQFNKLKMRESIKRGKSENTYRMSPFQNSPGSDATDGLEDNL